LIAEACAIAEQYNASVKADRLKTKEFAPAYARLFRQRASIYARRENWTQALDETIKARGILQPFVDVHLPKLTSEPDSTEIIDGFELGELGYYALLCEDQGDYETLLIRYSDAEETFLDAFQACKLAPRVENATRDGIISTSKILRKLQRIALMTNDFPNADKYYQQALALISKERLTDPLVEATWFYIESDRARGLAVNNPEEARDALKRAGESFHKIQTDPSAEFTAMRGNEMDIAEVVYSFAAAKSAIAKVVVEPEELQKQQDQEKLRQLGILQKQGASPLRLRELLFLP